MDLYQTIGNIFRPVSEEAIQQLEALQKIHAISLKIQEGAAAITIPSMEVEDVEFKEIKPTTITADIYSEIAEYIRESMREEESGRDYTTFCFDIKGFCPPSSNGNMEVGVKGDITVRYYREEWGTEGHIQSVFISSSRCQTWDDDGDDTDNNFSEDELIEYLKD